MDLCYEIHPGEDLFDGATFERFVAAVDEHPRACILFDPSHLIRTTTKAFDAFAATGADSDLRRRILGIG